MFVASDGFKPDFTKSGGLIAAVAQDAESGEILMLAWMNEEAWNATLATGEAHYWSRSRKALWHKGESSGNIQKIRAIRLDCDSDAVVLEVVQVGGAACHTGRKSCFYRRIRPELPDIEICSPQVFDPAKVYKQ